MTINGTEVAMKQPAGDAEAIDDLLELSAEYVTAERFNDAERLLAEVLAIHPDHAEALHRRAILAAHGGRLDEALGYAEAAVATGSDVAEIHYTVGVLRREAGRLDDAIVAWMKTADLAPDHVGARFNLATALRELGQEDASAAAYGTVLDIDPDHVAARFARANLLQSGGRLEEAIEDYGKLLEHTDDPKILNNLGVALQRMGRVRDAAAILAQAVERAPDNADAALNLGNALARLGNTEEAIGVVDAALVRHPNDSHLLNNRANMLRDCERFGEAVEAYFTAAAAAPDFDDAHNNLGTTLRLWQAADPMAPIAASLDRWLVAHPGHPTPRHIAAAFGLGETTPEGAVAYARRLFDSCAEEFEQKLMGELEYKGPEMLGRLAVELAPAGAGLDILDAGCGTGLCGRLLRDLAGRLDGIDLAPNMLAQSARLGIYDLLEEAEIVAFLSAHPARYDLIAAADVFIYVGDIGPAMKAAAKALKPEGFILFTVEEGAEDGLPTRLMPHGRFVHSAGAVSRALAEAGLVQRRLQRFALRREGGRAVPAFLVAAGLS
jgi:predicted TPR repeat methyltransferase